MTVDTSRPTRRWLSALCFAWLFFVQANAQPATDSLTAAAELIACATDYYGTNDFLVNGRPYIEPRPRANGHPYFQSRDWMPGALYLGDKVFDNVSLRYTLDDNQLLLRRQLVNGLTVEVSLPAPLIDSFHLGAHRFIRRELLGDAAREALFWEIIYRGGVSLYRAQRKAFIPNFTQSAPHGRYSLPQSRLLFFQQSRVHELSKASVLLDFFGDDKKTMRQFLRRERIKLRTANQQQLHDVLQYYDALH